MKKLHAPFTLASYVLYFFINSLILYMQETISLICNPEGWTAGQGESKPKWVFAFSRTENTFRNSPHIRKEMNHTEFSCLERFLVYINEETNNNNNNKAHKQQQTPPTHPPTNKQRQISKGFCGLQQMIYTPNNCFYCRRDTALPRSFFLPSVIPCFSSLLPLGDNFLPNYTSS